MSFMMSKDGYLGDAVRQWHSHLMFYIPQTDISTWGANQRRGAVVAVTRPFNWATKLGYVAGNPVRGVERPQAERRVSKLTPDDFRVLLSHIKDEPFRGSPTRAESGPKRPARSRPGTAGST